MVRNANIKRFCKFWHTPDNKERFISYMKNLVDCGGIPKSHRSPYITLSDWILSQYVNFMVPATIDLTQEERRKISDNWAKVVERTINKRYFELEIK